MKTFTVTVHLKNVVGDDVDEDTMKKSIKEAMKAAIDLDEAGEEELAYSFEEQEDDLNF